MRVAGEETPGQSVQEEQPDWAGLREITHEHDTDH